MISGFLGVLREFDRIQLDAEQLLNTAVSGVDRVLDDVAGFLGVDVLCVDVLAGVKDVDGLSAEIELWQTDDRVLTVDFGRS